MKKRATYSFYLLIGAALLLLTGCATSNREDLTVNLSNNLQQDTIQVDVAGLKQEQIAKYNNLNSADYWALGSKYRDGLSKRTIEFYPGKKTSSTITSSSPAWDMWKLNGDNYLLIAVDLPPTIGNSINWKLIIPMPYYSQFNFWSDRKNDFTVDAEGLTYVD